MSRMMLLTLPSWHHLLLRQVRDRAIRRCFGRTLFLCLLICSGASISSISHAETCETVVIPAGTNQGLGPTGAVARALHMRLSMGNHGKVCLAYRLPPEPSKKSGKEKEVKRLLKKAHSAYEMMEYAMVETRINAALKLNKILIKMGKSSAGYVMSLQLLAAAALLQGKNQEAVWAMNDAILFDRTPPPAKYFNPSVQEFHERVLAEPPPPGMLILNVKPEGLVWFNGELHGRSRGKMKLRSGHYLMTVYTPGYMLVKKWIKIKPGQKIQETISLDKDNEPEDPLMISLREEAIGPAPGAAVNQAILDFMAPQIVLLTSDQTCQPRSCLIRLHWAKDGKWRRQSKASYQGKASVTSAQLLGLKGINTAVASNSQVNSEALLPTNGQSCTLDSQCALNKKCRDGQCVELTPTTHKWWFWTLVGAAVAGATVAIVLPLTRPDNPVIEVK